eukprot:11154416-Lingulodinium_polyedra.AAC.1
MQSAAKARSQASQARRPFPASRKRVANATTNRAARGDTGASRESVRRCLSPNPRGRTDPQEKCEMASSRG